MSIEIQTDRFLLRELTEGDVTERYLGWLQDADAQKYITGAAKTVRLADLRQYVCDRINRNDILFLGIFEQASGLHIGNIKYEPVDQVLGYAIMGILIGDRSYRGKGVGTEVLIASAQWLKHHRGIKQIVLGVDAENVAGMKSYQKAGFIVADTPYIQKSASGQITMVWNIQKSDIEFDEHTR